MKKIFFVFIISVISCFSQDIISSSDLVKKANSKISSIEPLKVEELLYKENVLIIDVREAYETHGGKINHANVTNVPRGLLEFKASDLKLPFYDKVIIMCQAGARGSLATLSLQNMGYSNVFNMTGGYDQWSKDCLPSKKQNNLYFFNPNQSNFNNSIDVFKPEGKCISK